MRLKLFSCHHLAPRFCCNSEIFQTLVSNLPAPADGAFMSDLGGVNIAGDNLYSEMRHQFFVWKNLLHKYDYIGFEHYRRPFFIDPLPAARVHAEFPDVFDLRRHFASFAIAGMKRGTAGFGAYLDMRRSLDAEAVARVKDWIGSYDVVVPKANDENIEAQWKQCHDTPCWDVMVDAVNGSDFFRGRPNFVHFQMSRCYFANMYIMRRDLLDEYLTFCFDVLDRCRRQVALTGRALGYFSERVFSFWLYQKRIETPTLRVLELPFLFYAPELDADG
jgi:hypothetical protein